MTYDSRPDTRRHIDAVQALLGIAASDLDRRAEQHDASKLVPPEVDTFDEYTPKLRDTPYGSEGYEENLRAMKPALDHHYAVNDHHPEHFGEPGPAPAPEGSDAPPPLIDDPVFTLGVWHGGIFDMSAVQLLEMCADMIAASRRHEHGSVIESLPRHAAKHFYAGTPLERTVELTVHHLLCLERGERART